jgi:hypothetical protein
VNVCADNSRRAGGPATCSLKQLLLLLQLCLYQVHTQVAAAVTLRWCAAVQGIKDASQLMGGGAAQCQAQLSEGGIGAPEAAPRQARAVCGGTQGTLPASMECSCADVRKASGVGCLLLVAGTLRYPGSDTALANTRARLCSTVTCGSNWMFLDRNRNHKGHAAKQSKSQTIQRCDPSPAHMFIWSASSRQPLGQVMTDWSGHCPRLSRSDCQRTAPINYRGQ